MQSSLAAWNCMVAASHEPVTKAGVKELSVSLPTGRLSGAAPQMTKAWPELLLPLKG